MRKIKLLAGLVLLTSIGFFTSCSKDSTEDLSPSISFIGGTGFTDGDVSLDAGELFKVGITAAANATSGKNLVKFKVVRTFDNIPVTVLDSTINTDNFSVQFTTTAVPEVGQERWTFTITDKDGELNELSFIVTTAATAGEINSYDDIILGSYDNATYGSSFASSTGTVYKIADAKLNSAKVDWVYFYGVTNLATLAAPDNADAATIFTGANGLTNWATRNATRFSKVTSAIVWDNITNDSEITAVAGGASESKESQLQTGNILAFKTTSGKMGLIKIGVITSGAAGSIGYSVKVQK
jgi:hypothetical protein